VDLATTVVFGPNVTPFETTISASHVTQLRTAVNAVRMLSGLAAVTLTDTALAGVAPKALHIVELRDALSDARSALVLPPWPYSTPAPVAGQSFAAAHINDLRGGVR
jgi:hypothetical protein